MCTSRSAPASVAAVTLGARTSSAWKPRTWSGCSSGLQDSRYSQLTPAARSSRSNPMFWKATEPSGLRKSRVTPTRNVSDIAGYSSSGGITPLFQDEAAIETALTRGNDAVPTLRPLVKRHALDAAHGQCLAFGPIDFCLHFLMDGQNLFGGADDFHPNGGAVDKAVERQHRENCPDCPRGIDAIHSEDVAERRLPRDRIRWKIRIYDD